MSSLNRHIRLKPVEVVMLALGTPSAVVIGLVDPRTGGVAIPCIFRVCTGLECPGCGSTRVVHDILNLEIARAVSTNPLAVSIIVLAGFATISRLRNGRWPIWRVRKFATFLVVSGVGLFGVARNLPFEPFSSLAAG